MKAFLKKIISGTTRTIVFAICGGLSVFLVMSGYESVYNRSLPLVHTLDPVNLTAYRATFDLQQAARNDTALYGSFGKPTNVKLPERAARLDIGPAIYSNNQWLGRANGLHLLIPQQPRNGNIGMALLYCRSSFRTLNDQNLPQVGSNIFMDTDKDWRYVYKVTIAKVYSDKTPYITSDTGRGSRLVISCNDQAAGANVVVEATLLSVQGVE